jgi:hypothetical protein
VSGQFGPTEIPAAHPNQDAGPASADRSAVVQADNRGIVSTGDYAMTIMADRSTVTVIKPAERPRPRRRARLGLPPRRQADPLGRSAESDLIYRAVAEGGPVVVTGPPGVGKSTVVRDAAWRLHTEDGPVIFLDAAGQDVSDVLQRVFEACYDNAVYRPGPVELRRLMAGMRFRLVVDHLACPSQQWPSFLDAVPDAVVVAAVADGDVPAEGRLIRLRGLDRGAARDLLSRSMGAALREEDLPAADALWQATAGLPGRLVAAAARGTAGVPVLPDAADLPGLLLGGLARQEREILALLALGGACEVDPHLLTALLRTPRDAADDLRLLTALGLVAFSERGCRLAAGIAGVLPPDLRAGPADAERICDALRTWATAPGTAPRTVANHAPLITAAIDLAAGSGHPDAAVRLARAAAPALARSLRTRAWADVLDRGLAAARAARDEPARAYLAHEAGVRHLVTGEPEAAAALFMTAATIWDSIGNATLAAAARNSQALCAPIQPGHPAGYPRGFHAPGGAYPAIGPNPSGPSPTRPATPSHPTAGPAAPLRAAASHPVRPSAKSSRGHRNGCLAGIAVAAMVLVVVGLVSTVRAFLSDSQPQIVRSATGSPPWTTRGFDITFTVTAVKRTTRPGSDGRPQRWITVTAHVTRAQVPDSSDLSYRVSDQGSASVLDNNQLGNGSDGNPPLNQRGKLIFDFADDDPAARHLTITIHDFFWPAERNLILRDIPVPP